GDEYSYAYGPSGVVGLLHNRYALLCALFASIGGLSFGYDQGVIANVLVMDDFVRRWPVTPFQQGSMTSVLELGALLGAVASGVFADRISRTHSILIASVVFLIGALVQCLAQSLTHMFIGRTVGGVGVGALSMLTPLYISEVSPPELRGSLMALEQFSIVFGVVLGFWTGFFTRNVPGPASWRIPLGIQLIPGIILAIGCLFLPPSPRLLVLQGRYGDARDTLYRLRLPRDEDDKILVEIEFLEMRVEAALIQQQYPATESKGGYAEWSQLFGRDYRARTAVGVLVAFFQQWSGINALLYYGPELIASFGLHGTAELLVSGGIGIVQFIAVLPTIAYIDRLGRKPLLRGGSAVMSAAHLLIAFLANQYGSDWQAHSAGAVVAVLSIYVFTFAFGTSFGPIAWILPSEVFPLSVRSKGVAISVASTWLNNFFVGLLTPVLIDISTSLTFLLFSTASFVAYMWATYYVPETAGVPLEEIGAVFGGEMEVEEAALRQQIEEDVGLRHLVRRAAA
ncbi:general substrate transporter, partial [Fistulina hepatica ATCC 64428]